MKRKVIASVIGAAALVGLAASSYGQGQVFFNTYASTGYFPVTYGAQAQTALNVGQYSAGPNVDVELGYFLGTSSDASQFTLIPSTIEALGTDSQAVNGTGPSATGYIEGGTIATISSYTSGPISFEILAWVASGNGAGAGAGAGSFAGSQYSDFNNIFTWTEPSIATGQSAAGYFQALNGNAVLNPVPEPSTLALAGLGGLASLMAFRRKKA
jgi:hypothetical protein